MFSFWILPENQQKNNPTPTTQPTPTPNQRRSFDTEKHTKSCKAKRLGAWQKEQILLGALVTPLPQRLPVRWSLEEGCLLSRPFVWNVRLDFGRFELWLWMVEDMFFCYCFFPIYIWCYLSCCCLCFSLDFSKYQNIQDELWSSQKWGYNISLETSWYS